MLMQVNRADPEGKIKQRFLALLGVENEVFGRGESIWPLPNLEETTVAEFFGWQSSYSFTAQAHLLQFKHEDVDQEDSSDIFKHPRWSHAWVYLVDHGHLEGGGYAVLYTYNRRADYGKKPGECGDALGSKDANAPCIQVYTWRQCVHEFTQQNVGRCLNKYTCKKCGANHTIDSSD
jgi:hypothetical protein